MIEKRIFTLGTRTVTGHDIPERTLPTDLSYSAGFASFTVNGERHDMILKDFIDATQELQPRTEAELADLKSQWKYDPCWDIEVSDGFEYHYEELLAYRLETEQKWDEARSKELLDFSHQLGAPGNITLARYVQALERRITKLEEHGLRGGR